MFTFLAFTTLVLTVTRLTSGYEELIGLPDENDNDIWNDNPESTKQQSEDSQALLQSLCDNYDFTIDGRIINCNNLKLVEKSLKVPAEHLLRKREIEHEEPVEGSGDGDQEDIKTTTPETPSDHTGHENVATKHTETAENLNTYQDNNVLDVNAGDPEKGDHSKHVVKNAELAVLTSEKKPDEIDEKPTLQTEHQQKFEKSSEAERTSTTTQTPVEVTSTTAKQSDEQMPEKPVVIAEPKSEKPSEENTTAPVTPEVIAEPKSEKPSEENTTAPVTPEVIAEPKSEKPSEENTTAPVTPGEKTIEQKPTTEHKEDQPKEKTTEVKPLESTSLQPSKEEKIPEVSQKPVVERKPVEPETSKLPDNTTQSPTESVTPKEAQDKNLKANGDKDSKKNVNLDVKSSTVEPKEQSIPEGNDKKGRKLKAPETEIQTAAVGETKESVSQKDSKILLGLFGAVVGMGAAAFVYHQIRKRRANAARNSINGVGKNDPEEGREMKPLMKNGEEKNLTVDFKDETQDRTEEVKS